MALRDSWGIDISSILFVSWVYLLVLLFPRFAMQKFATHSVPRLVEVRLEGDREGDIFVTWARKNEWEVIC